MIKRTEEERLVLKRIVGENKEKKLSDLVTLINSDRALKLSGPVNRCYLTFLRYPRKKSRNSTIRNRILSNPKNTPNQEYSFDIFLLKMEELADYARKLRDVSQEKAAALFLA